MNEIVEFIRRRFPVDCDWTTGNCYYFAVILQARFPDGQIVYDPIDGHFLFLYHDRLYDYKGKAKSRSYVLWDDYDKYDALQKQVIIRDCIR